MQHLISDVFKDHLINDIINHIIYLYHKSILKTIEDRIIEIRYDDKQLYRKVYIKKIEKYYPKHPLSSVVSYCVGCSTFIKFEYPNLLISYKINSDYYYHQKIIHKHCLAKITNYHLN